MVTRRKNTIGWQKQEQVFDLDREWFMNNPHRKLRLRAITPVEGFGSSHVLAGRFGNDVDMWIGLSPMSLPEGSLDDVTDEQIGEIVQASGEKWPTVWKILMCLSQIAAGTDGEQG